MQEGGVATEFHHGFCTGIFHKDDFWAVFFGREDNTKSHTDRNPNKKVGEQDRDDRDDKQSEMQMARLVLLNKQTWAAELEKAA